MPVRSAQNCRPPNFLARVCPTGCETPASPDRNPATAVADDIPIQNPQHRRQHRHPLVEALTSHLLTQQLWALPTACSPVCSARWSPPVWSTAVWLTAGFAQVHVFEDPQRSAWRLAVEPEMLRQFPRATLTPGLPKAGQLFADWPASEPEKHHPVIPAKARPHYSEKPSAGNTRDE